MESRQLALAKMRVVSGNVIHHANSNWLAGWGGSNQLLAYCGIDASRSPSSTESGALVFDESDRLG
jgi:hypothetical protein